jgi:hypothetical protein
VVETAATAARAARLAMVELVAARAEVEEAAAAAEVEALRASSIGSSVSADDDRDNELKLAREAAREQQAFSITNSLNRSLLQQLQAILYRMPCR